MEPLPIPYHSEFVLGHSFDVKGWSPCPGSADDQGCINIEQINALSTAFAVVTSLDTVCDALGIHPDYALKVASKLIPNTMVSACLDCVVKDNKHSRAMIIRATFLQQRQSASSRTNERTWHAGRPTTHWVRSLDVGKELVILVKFHSKDDGVIKDVFESMTNKLICLQGPLDVEMIGRLETFANKWDKKMSKGAYKNLNVGIYYYSYSADESYPVHLKGMMNTVKDILNYYGDLTLEKRTERDYSIRSTDKKCLEGMVKEERQVQQLTEKVKKILGGQGNPTDETQCPKRNETFYFLRATISSVTRDKAASELPEESNAGASPTPRREFQQNDYDRVYKQLLRAQKAQVKIKDILNTLCVDCDETTQQANATLTRVNTYLQMLADLMGELDFTTMPSVQMLTKILDENIFKEVELTLKRPTTVPRGPDLDFLIIGKTGNGKSTTANSILHQHKFKTSSSGKSETTVGSMYWNSVDGRIMKVVDTPGVYDTRSDETETGIELVIHALSKAIAKCNTGFHALLVVLKFGERMTNQEKKAIRLLKDVLGKDIIKRHSIFVFTHGDDFRRESMGKGNRSFRAWFEKEKENFNMLEEGNYRCVLFDNVTTDETVRKSQLVKLVYMTDQLCSNGVHYTSRIFQLASERRQRAILDQDSPEAGEDFLKAIQVVLNQLKRMTEGINIDNENDPDIIVLKLRLETFKSMIEKDCPNCTISSNVDKIKVQLDGKTCTQEDLNEFKEIVQNYYQTEVQPSAEKVEGIVTEAVQEDISSSSCFPGSSKVTLRDGKTKMIQDLAVGDQVLVRKGNGELGLDTVYMFGHSDFESRAEFLVIKTTSTSVSVTEGHCVHCFKEGVEVCIPARQIVSGDKMLVRDAGQLLLETVCEIKHETKQGMFAPFTYSGTIIVDGSLMSCYVDVLDPRVSHVLLWPIRKLYSVSPRTLAWLNGTGKQNVMPPWAKMALKWM